MTCSGIAEAWLLILVCRDIVGAHNAGFEGVLLTSKYKLGRCSAEQEALMHAVPHTKLFHLKDLPKTLGVPPIQ